MDIIMEISFLIIIVGYGIFHGITHLMKKRKENLLYASTNSRNFGYKMMWFAVRNADQKRIAKVLNLMNGKRVDWYKALEEVYDKNAIFISPEIDEWTFVIGWDTVESGDNEAKTKELCKILSKEFGEAHYYATHRVSEYHAWIIAKNGSIKRVYSYSGEKFENIEVYGKESKYEEKFNLINTFSDEAQNEDYLDSDDILIPDEEFVLNLAASLSVDTRTLDNRKEVDNYGLLYKMRSE